MEILVWGGTVHSSSLLESRGCLGRSKVGNFDLKLDFSNVKILVLGGYCAFEQPLEIERVFL